VSQADEASGEVVALFVVKKDPRSYRRRIDRAIVDRSSPATRFPDTCISADTLPKTNVGKILRRRPAG